MAARECNASRVGPVCGSGGDLLHDGGGGTCSGDDAVSASFYFTAPVLLLLVRVESACRATYSTRACTIQLFPPSNCSSKQEAAILTRR